MIIIVLRELILVRKANIIKSVKGRVFRKDNTEKHDQI